MGHIQLSRAADLVVVAPATADLMAKMAAGLAGDLATTLLLATDKRVLIAPAMNVRMWEHPATQRNLAQLLTDGVLSVGPNAGDMACGEFGPGRMAEPLEIVAAIEAALAPDLPLAGRHVLVTSGPTHEPIDPVRYIANRSSGAQGAALAAALRDLGAHVSFVTGPATVPPPAGVAVHRVETAAQMLAAVEAALPADAAVFAAAVADWRVTDAAAQKTKKGAGGPPALLSDPALKNCTTDFDCLKQAADLNFTDTALGCSLGAASLACVQTKCVCANAQFHDALPPSLQGFLENNVAKYRIDESAVGSDKLYTEPRWSSSALVFYVDSPSNAFVLGSALAGACLTLVTLLLAVRAKAALKDTKLKLN
jgi:hypothetical protein